MQPNTVTIPTNAINVTAIICFLLCRNKMN